jgi:SAM-dependent methyltransferase
MSDLEFTGERLVPDKVDAGLWYEHIARYLLAADFVSGKRVLDAGCGAGYGADLLAARGAGFVLGVDISRDAVAYAVAHYARPNLEYRTWDVTTAGAGIDASGGRFEMIVSFEVIEHLQDPDAFLAAAAGLLGDDSEHDGGMLIVSTPDRIAYRPADDPNPYHTREFDFDEFRQLLGRHFRHVRLFAQHYLPAVAVTETDGSGDLLIPGRLLRTDRYHRYFIAFCGNSPTPDLKGAPRLIPFGAIDWQAFIIAAARDVGGVVPPGSTLVLIDQQTCGSGLTAGRQAVPLVERDGLDWGPPADDVQAVMELERRREAGAGFVVIARPAFWWLDHYAGFARHLRSRCRCILENERVIVFNLRPEDG